MNILLVGKPGSGKGTITKILIEKDDFVHLSTGDLLRQEIATGSELGKKLELLLKDGNFASDDVIFTLVTKFIKENEDKSIIFDGFPRNLKQAEKCKELKIHFDHIFYLDVPNEILEERILNRRIHLPSGRSYNLKTIPPKVEGLDDITGEPLTHRSDDTKEALAQRIKTYKKETEPILNYLESNGYPINRMNGSVDYKELALYINLKIKLNLLEQEANNLNIIKKQFSEIKNLSLPLDVTSQTNDANQYESSEKIIKLREKNEKLNNKSKKPII